MDPFSFATGVVGLIGVALKLVTSALGMIDKTIAAHEEAAAELDKLQGDLEDLQAQMMDIHTTLKVLASSTKDQAFKRLLRDEDCKAALTRLCIVLDETFVVLRRLTDRTEAQESTLHSLSPPDDTRSLEFVQAVLKHTLAPSKTTNLVRSLQDMRSEIQKCSRKLDTAYQHTWGLYFVMSNRLARTTTIGSTFSTSTALTARLKFVDWLKDRQDTWGISKQRNDGLLSAAFNPDHPTGSDPLGSLPAGWEERTTPEGTAYFIHNDTHSATLIDPRLDPIPSGWEMRLTSTSHLDHNIRPVTLNGLFSVATTSTKPPAVIKEDIRRALDRMHLQYHEIRGGFECLHMPSIDFTSVIADAQAYQQQHALEELPGEIPVNTAALQEQDPNVLSPSQSAQAGANATTSQPVSPTRNKSLPPIPQEFTAQQMQEQQKVQGTVTSKTSGAGGYTATPTPFVGPPTPTPGPGGLITVDDLSEMSSGSAVAVRFEINILKIPLLPMHGIQFRRAGGDGWQYQMLARRVLTELKL